MIFEKRLRKPSPSIDDKRTITRLALLPTEVVYLPNDGTPERDVWVWLERYEVRQTYRMFWHTRDVFGNTFFKGWRDEAKTLSRRQNEKTDSSNNHDFIGRMLGL